MGIMLNKEDDKNANLSRRIDADLRSKMEAVSKLEDDTTDAVEGSDFAKDLKKTSRFAWVWIILILVAAIALIVVGLLK